MSIGGGAVEPCKETVNSQVSGASGGNQSNRECPRNADPTEVAEDHVRYQVAMPDGSASGHGVAPTSSQSWDSQSWDSQSWDSQSWDVHSSNNSTAQRYC